MSSDFMRFGLLALSALLTASSPAFAQFELKARVSNAADEKLLQPLLDEAASRLPESLKRAIDRPVEVGFAKLRKGALGTSMRAFLVGKRVIFLDRSLRDELARGQSDKARFVVVHEVSHIYDFEAAPTAQDAAVIKRCDELQVRHDESPGPEQIEVCGEAAYLKNKISTHREYISAANFANAALSEQSISSRNQNEERSPDLYEFKNLQESFATNFEYFILDPTFACRRPVLNDLFVRHFEHIQFKEGSCKPFTKVVETSSTGRSALVDIDPSRIYEIHYLLAAKGEAMMSRWGHAMFRLITCAPNHAVGPECLKDVSHHVVLSFRANIADLTINQVKGFFGGYPSQLFVLPMIDVLEEYNKGELRDLVSAPLVLSDAEKRRFLNGAIEHYWLYRGDYKFLTSNCASESYWLLRTAIEDGSFVRQSPTITPTGLFDVLSETGRIDTSRQIVFKTNRLPLDLAIRYLRGMNGAFHAKELKEYLKTSAADRAQLMRVLATAKPAAQAKIAANFYVLEAHVQRVRMKELMGAVMKKVEDAGGPEVMKKKYPELAGLIEKLKGSKPALKPAPRDNNDSHVGELRSYGVPLASELPSDDPHASASISPDEMKDLFVNALARVGLEKNLNEFLSGIENMKLFLAAISRPIGEL